jgi:hypothetical protein
MPITEIIQNDKEGTVITLKSNLFNDPANEKQLPLQLQLLQSSFTNFYVDADTFIKEIDF